MINRTNTVLAVLLAAVVVMTAAVGVDYSQPNIEILPDMKYTPAWEAFAANRNFPNGQTMQPPVPGTIARGHMPLYYAATKEDAARAGEELENPYSLASLEAAVAAERDAVEAKPDVPDETAPPGNAAPAAEAAQPSEAALREAMVRQRFSASVERGGEVYRTFCIACHGPQGAGDGLVTQRGFPPPPSMLTGKSLQMKDGQLFHILTYGQGSMLPFAAQLSRDRRWEVINYVRDLQSKAPPAPEISSADATATATPEPAAAPEAPGTQPQPTAEKAAADKAPEQEDAAPEEQEDTAPEKQGDAAPEKQTSKTPRNELRDRSADDGFPAPAASKQAEPSLEEGASE